MPLTFKHTPKIETRQSKTVEISDIKLHPCIELSRFEKDGIIQFIPPDGREFELMSYRLDGMNYCRSSTNSNYNYNSNSNSNDSSRGKAMIFVECYKNISQHSRIEYNIKVKNNLTSNMTVKHLKIMIPVPNDIDSPKFLNKIGKCKYVPENNCIEWCINQLTGGKRCDLKASVRLPTVTAYDAGQERDNQILTSKRENGDTCTFSVAGTRSKPPIKVKFEVPYLSASGIRVRYLKVLEKSGYQALPWVRYFTQSGNYAVRT